MSGTRRLTAAGAERIAEGMRLDIHATRYFLALAAFQDAETDRQKREAERVMRGMARYRASTPIERDQLAVFSAWYVSVVIELLRIPGAQTDPAWIARAVVPPITEAQAREALEILQRLGIFTVGDDGEVHCDTAQLTTPHQVDDDLAAEAVRASTRQWLQRADDALVTLPHDVRQFGCITLTIAPEHIEEFRTEVQRFQQRILGMERESRGPDDAVHQLMVQFFPVTSAGQSTKA